MPNMFTSSTGIRRIFYSIKISESLHISRQNSFLVIMNDISSLSFPYPFFFHSRIIPYLTGKFADRISYKRQLKENCVPKRLLLYLPGFHQKSSLVDGRMDHIEYTKLYHTEALEGIHLGAPILFSTM